MDAEYVCLENSNLTEEELLRAVMGRAMVGLLLVNKLPLLLQTAKHAH